MNLKNEFSKSKQLSPTAFKFAADDAGRIEGYGSVFGNIDSAGERVLRGAFKNSIARHRSDGSMPLMLWQHKTAEPLGRWTSMVEDGIGLRMVGVLNLKTSRGADAHEHLKAGDVSGLSIGYREVKVKANGQILDLIELDLLETSVVSFPANPRSRVSGVKCDSQADVERLLREAGLARRAAEKIANGGWPALSNENEPSPKLDELLAVVKAARLELKASK